MEAVYHPLLRHKGRMILCLSRSVKRNSKLFRALPHFLIFLAVAAPALAQVYKWVDERGVTHYGERPPQGGKASEVPDRLASPPSGSVPGPQGSTQSNPRQGESPPSEREPRPAAPQTEPTEDRLTRRQEQCNQQRELLARLSQNPRAEIADAIARQEKLVAEQCKDSERPPQSGKANEAPSRLGQGEIPAKDREPRPGTTQTERTEDQQTRRQEQCNQQRELLARLKQSPQPENSDAIARQEKLAAEQCRG